jgi:hypothetical protein
MARAQGPWLAFGVALALAAGALTGCDDESTGRADADAADGGAADTSSDVPFHLAQGASVSKLVTAVAGGTVEAPTGDRLVVPPGALAKDTLITMVPIAVEPAADLDFFAGVSFAPDGLVFAQPAILTLRLPITLPAGTQVMLGESFGAASPRQFGTGDVLFTVDASGVTATGPIRGFSGKAVMKNCHSGTRDAVLAGWAGRPGLDPASVGARTGLPAEQLTRCDLPADPLQTMLAPYFDKCGEADPANKDFGAANHQTIRTTLMAGRQVVFLFAGALDFDATTGQYRGIAHSAVAVMVNGRILVRNQVYITNPDKLAQLEQTGTTVDMPLDDIDKPGEGLRDMRNSEVYRRLLNQPFAPGVRDTTPLAWPAVVVLCEKAGLAPDAAAVDGPSDAGVAGPVDAPIDNAPPVCPTETNTVGFCAGENQCPAGGAACACPAGSEFCCTPGFCYTRYIAGCSQETCPAGAGRNYTNHCMCGPTMKSVYDPCRAGLLLRCDPL